MLGLGLGLGLGSFGTATCLARFTWVSEMPRACNQRQLSTLPAAAAHCTAAQPKRLSAATSTWVGLGLGLGMGLRLGLGLRG